MTEANGDEVRRLRELAERNRIAKLRAMGREMEARERETEARHRQQELTAQLESLTSSRSWKLTKPLRDFTEWARTSRQSSVAPGPTSAGESGRGQEFAAAVADESPGAEPAWSRSDDRFVTAGKETWDEVGGHRLNDFLRSERSLCFPSPAAPTVSIIVAMYDEAHLSFLCLEAILRNADAAYELILIDNASTDRTGQLLERVAGAKTVRNPQNMGFGYACMQGAEHAAGQFLCFLNNDAILVAGSLTAAVADFREGKDVGAVGGKILFADGRLQEAGAMVWQDGTAWGYGRGQDSNLLRFQFRRPVDYCSGAFLLTPRALFEEVGGFDERFLPAYYEDTDYCFKLWDKGCQVLYEPWAAIHHYESASFADLNASKAAIVQKRAAFAEKWRQRLAAQLACRGDRIPYARIAAQVGGARILYLDDNGPQHGAAPRAKELIARLSAEGHHLTWASMSQPLPAAEDAGFCRDVEMADATAEAHYVFRDLLSQYDVAWVRGRNSMRDLLWRLRDMDERIAPIVYEPEAITSGESAMEEGGRFQEDVTLWQAADAVLVESEADRQILLDNRVGNVFVFSETNVAQLLKEVALAAPTVLSAGL